MAFGQPFYNYGTNPYGGQNNGYVAPQQPQYGNFYGQPQNAPQNVNNGATQQFQGQPQQQQVQQMPPRTNIAPVASLMDAMSRTSEPNTNIYYADQDQPFIYQISIDMQGRKTYKTFKIEDVTEQTQQLGEGVAPNMDLSAYATKNDLKALKDEITSYAMSFFNSQPTANPVSIPTQAVVSKPKTNTKKTDNENKE